MLRIILLFPVLFSLAIAFRLAGVLAGMALCFALYMQTSFFSPKPVLRKKALIYIQLLVPVAVFITLAPFNTYLMESGIAQKIAEITLYPMALDRIVLHETGAAPSAEAAEWLHKSRFIFSTIFQNKTSLLASIISSFLCFSIIFPMTLFCRVGVNNSAHSKKNISISLIGILIISLIFFAFSQYGWSLGTRGDWLALILPIVLLPAWMSTLYADDAYIGLSALERFTEKQDKKNGED
jgi:hypothetical protein